MIYTTGDGQGARCFYAVPSHYKFWHVVSSGEVRELSGGNDVTTIYPPYKYEEYYHDSSNRV